MFELRSKFFTLGKAIMFSSLSLNHNLHIFIGYMQLYLIHTESSPI